jgi:hypothetical protein
LCEQHYNLTPKGYVDVARARAHLITLNEAGFSWRHIARLTGLTEQGLYRVRDGERCQRVTEARILAVPPPQPLAGPGLINAVGSHRRIHALQALGWPHRILEERMGLPHRRISTMLARPKIYTPMARKISDVYDELSMQPGPSERTREIAREKGWTPPLAWDDDTIDDPDAMPDMGRGGCVSAFDRITELHEVGIADVGHIAECLGIKPDSVRKTIERNRKDVAA